MDETGSISFLRLGDQLDEGIANRPAPCNRPLWHVIAIAMIVTCKLIPIAMHPTTPNSAMKQRVVVNIDRARKSFGSLRLEGGLLVDCKKIKVVESICMTTMRLLLGPGI